MSRKCSGWIETYLEYSAHQQAPPRYHVWTAISVLGAAVGRNVHIDRGYFLLFPNLYLSLVGPTGFTKTTATEMGIDILAASMPPIDLIRGKMTVFHIYDLFTKKSVSGQDCIITLYSSELKNFIEGVAKTELITMLTELYTSPSKSGYHTKTGGSFNLSNVCINFLASSTPEWLTTGVTVNEISGGFTGRFLYIYADKGDRNIAFPEDFLTPETRALRQDLITDLNHIRTLKGQFVLTNQAKAEYIIWYNNRKSEWKDERLIGYYARKGDMVLKLGMLLSMAKSDALVIDENILHLAHEMLTKAEVSMGDSFTGVVDDPILRYKDTILAQIIRSTDSECTRQDLLKKNWNRLDGVVLDRIVTNLIEAGLVASSTRQGKVYYKIINQL